MLYLEVDSGGVGVLQRLANVLAERLGWPVSRDEVRHWLRKISVSSGPSLVIVLDGLGPDRDELYGDLEEITSGFGVKVRTVIGLDDNIADSLVLAPNRRKSSAIGRKAQRVRVGPLSDREFEDAMEVLFKSKVAVMPGGQEADEYRSPWILRVVAAGALLERSVLPEGAAHIVPSLLGTELVTYAREVFEDRPELQRHFHEIARAVLAETFREDRDIDLILHSLLIFLVRRSALAEVLDRQDIDELVTQGILRQILDGSGESMFVIRLPELVAAELATELANNVISQLKQKENPAERLSKAARLLPFGDIIAAQAILDSAARIGALPIDVLLWFFNNLPTQKPVKEGTPGRMFYPGLGAMDVEFKSEGEVHLVAGGQRINVGTDQGDFGSLQDQTNWLILSHVAAHPLGTESKDGILKGRIDQELLLEIGSSSSVLRRIGSRGYMLHLSHSIPGYGEIVCHKVGFIEPITLAIYKFLSREGEKANDWIEAAIKRQSLPLLHRIYLVLEMLESSTDPALAAWSTATKQNLVEPALSQFPPFRCD